ncbi:hypothetical protein [Maritimibacter sp. UBA3975]|uniref:hypothetical protein n=1 Tax=Maritimibacter sp. UBA3975 TaxID=1946833 RepID=UPI000C0A8E65|nr:hypothetical protein [Maritimibacter sp. UBA3975]MAM61914.1 hypothetical protein [Maritimibacter sp.]|tara:strand:- start:47601 stop:47945 length:345 start_codon:yes stop_codon:yes gene_type:complete
MDHLPENLREELAAAQKKKARKAAHMRVAVGEEMYPVLEFRDGGFALDIQDAPKLRGLVDLYAGPNHLYQCLIVASEADGALMRYDFKRSTAATDKAPLDFARDPDAPIALLPR